MSSRWLTWLVVTEWVRFLLVLNNEEQKKKNNDTTGTTDEGATGADTKPSTGAATLGDHPHPFGKGKKAAPRGLKPQHRLGWRNGAPRARRPAAVPGRRAFETLDPTPGPVSFHHRLSRSDVVASFTLQEYADSLRKRTRHGYFSCDTFSIHKPNCVSETYIHLIFGRHVSALTVRIARRLSAEGSEPVWALLGRDCWDRVDALVGDERALLSRGGEALRAPLGRTLRRLTVATVGAPAVRVQLRIDGVPRDGATVRAEEPPTSEYYQYSEIHLDGLPVYVFLHQTAEDWVENGAL